ncbi:MAG: MauE/DoxX family redox-associated membrane protein, partial [Candidatus Acidoferrales bacterium]
MLVRVLQWICRLALAAIFLYAGFVKAGNRFRFEMDLSTYQLLPDWGVIAVAAGLPWLEMALGAVLILGWKQRYVTTFTA